MLKSADATRGRGGAPALLDGRAVGLPLAGVTLCVIAPVLQVNRTASPGAMVKLVGEYCRAPLGTVIVFPAGAVLLLHALTTSAPATSVRERPTRAREIRDIDYRR